MLSAQDIREEVGCELDTDGVLPGLLATLPERDVDLLQERLRRQPLAEVSVYLHAPIERLYVRLVEPYAEIQEQLMPARQKCAEDVARALTELMRKHVAAQVADVNDEPHVVVAPLVAGFQLDLESGLVKARIPAVVMLAYHPRYDDVDDDPRWGGR